MREDEIPTSAQEEYYKYKLKSEKKRETERALNGFFKFGLFLCALFFFFHFYRACREVSIEMEAERMVQEAIQSTR